MSLLIVDVPGGDDYYITFFCGILTTVSLHYLHYRSQPRSADLHATRRNKDAGVWWNITNCFYSASLIGVGAAYKLFMYEFTYEARRLQDEDNMRDERFLAESINSAGRKQAAANVFSASMALVFTFLDVLILFHRGLKSSINRCKCARTKTRNKKGILLTIVRVAITLFFATLSQYESDPRRLSVLGLGGVVAQLIIRRLGFIIFADYEDQGTADNHFDPKEDEMDDEGTCSEVVPGQTPKIKNAVEREQPELADIPCQAKQFDIDLEDNKVPHVITSVEPKTGHEEKRDVVADNDEVSENLEEAKQCVNHVHETTQASIADPVTEAEHTEEPEKRAG